MPGMTSQGQASQSQWFGQPRGLSTLFFTEMWERFSYYGMRGILLLFLVNAVATGGFGMSDKTASAIYGLYVGLVYLMALPGGWIADRILGQRRAVFLGACIIAAGHFSMALPTRAHLLPGPLPDRRRHGIAQAQCQRDGGRPLSRRGRAAGRRLLDLLLGHQHRRSLRPARLRLSRGEDQLAPGLRRGGSRDGLRPRAIPARRKVPRRRGTSRGRARRPGRPPADGRRRSRRSRSRSPFSRVSWSRASSSSHSSRWRRARASSWPSSPCCISPLCCSSAS